MTPSIKRIKKYDPLWRDGYEYIILQMRELEEALAWIISYCNEIPAKTLEGTVIQTRIKDKANKALGPFGCRRRLQFPLSPQLELEPKESTP